MIRRLSCQSLTTFADSRTGGASGPSWKRAIIKKMKRSPADRQFWRELKKAFREGDARVEHGSLRVRWNSIYGTYRLLGSEQAQSRFKVLAEAAARDLPKRIGVEPWKLWLAKKDQLLGAFPHGRAESSRSQACCCSGHAANPKGT